MTAFACAAVGAQAQIPAFPGAEGYGAYAVGGRNGDVYHVTNLNASGQGSFFDAIATAPTAGRTIVFDVSGYIRLPSGSNGTRITASKITIAGQTAPGDGIGFYNNFLRISGDDIVLRHLRFRHGKYGSGGDCIDLDSGCLNAMLDHVSMQFSTDENISSFGSPPENLTLQYSINAWGLESHSCGGLWDQNHATSHHNLWAYNHTRNPKARPTGLLEWINNVTFDWDIGFIMGDTESVQNYKANVINNYFIGPPGNTQSKALVKGTVATNGKPNFTVYLGGNLTDIDGDGLLNGIDRGYSIVEGSEYSATESPAPAAGAFRYYKSAAAIAGSTAGVATDNALTAYKKIVSNAGALRLDASYTGGIRDEVDTILFNRLVTQTHTSSGGNTGISRESDTGASNSGFGTLNSTAAPVDTDKDGMPDYYEDALLWNKALDDHATALASSGGLITGTTFFPANTPAGYTRLEEYLHFLAIPHGVVAKNVAGTPTSIAIDLKKYTGGFLSSPTYAVSNVVGGTVALGGAGNATATFTPTVNYTGRARFDFTVTDSGQTWTQTCALVVSNTGLPRDLAWKGVGSAWDQTASNWLRPANGSMVAFSNGDRVTFDDNGIAQPSVSVSGALTPTTVEVNASGNYTLGGSGSIASSGTLAKRGSGTLTLTGSESYAGGGSIEAGALVIGPAGDLEGGVFTMFDGTTFTNGYATGNTASIGAGFNVPAGNSVTINSGNRLALTGAITGAGMLNLNVQTTVTRFDLGGPAAAFAGQINFTNGGGVRLFFNGGTFNGFDNASVDIGGAVSLQPQTNSTPGNTLNIGALSGSSAAANLAGGTAGAVAYVVGSKGLNTTFAGSIAGNATLTKTGAGILYLSGASTYTGATTVSAGRLAVDGSLGSTPVSVQSGAILARGGSIGNTVTGASGGILAPGANAGASPGALTVNGLAATGTTYAYELTSNPNGANDKIIVANNGTAAITGNQYFLLNLVDGVLGAGTYMLVDNTGTGPLSVTSGAGLTSNLPTSGTRQTFALGRSASGTAGGDIWLTVTGNPVTLTWNGSASNVWQVDTSATASGWTGGTQTQPNFFNVDAVTFNDTAPSTAVTISGLVQPRALNVNNTSKNYIFSGNGGIAGSGTLTKSGAGTLTITLPAAVGVASTNSASSNSVAVAAADSLVVGMFVTGNGVPGGTSITAISGTTLTLSQAVTAANSGATFNYAWRNTFSGGTFLNGGTIQLGNDNANAYGLGLGTIAFNGGALTMFDDDSSYNAATYNLLVPAGQTGALNADARCDLYGTLSGGGTLNFYVPWIRTTLFSDWSAFTGLLNVITDSTGGDLRMGTSYSFPGFPRATVNLADKVWAYYVGTLSSGAGTTIEIGELTGGPLSGLMGGATGARNFTYRIGGKTASGNEAVFAGAIQEQNTGTTTSFVKTGDGIWTLGGACSWNGGTTVEQGTLKISGSVTCGAATSVSAGARLTLAGGTLSTDALNVAANATLAGAGTIDGDLNNSGTVDCGSGALVVTGDVVNDGTMRFSGGAALNATGGFVNNGVLDLLTGAQGLPANLVNNGAVIVNSDRRVLSTSKAGANFLCTVRGYTGHTYQLQRADSLTGTWASVGAAQAGSGSVLTFTDAGGATGAQGFYRVWVSP